MNTSINPNTKPNTEQVRHLKQGDTVIVDKGCRARGINKGSHAYLETVTELGADYGHSVKVVLSFGHRKVVFYARHRNRLGDAFVSLNDGNPSHRITIRKRA